MILTFCPIGCNEKLNGCPVEINVNRWDDAFDELRTKQSSAS